MFQKVIEELRAMSERVDKLAAEAAEAGLEFEGEALEDLASMMRDATAEMADANLAIRSVVPSDMAIEVRELMVRHGLAVASKGEE
jgi:hypothetical protein